MADDENVVPIGKAREQKLVRDALEQIANAVPFKHLLHLADSDVKFDYAMSGPADRAVLSVFMHAIVDGRGVEIGCIQMKPEQWVEMRDQVDRMIETFNAACNKRSPS